MKNLAARLMNETRRSFIFLFIIIFPFTFLANIPGIVLVEPGPPEYPPGTLSYRHMSPYDIAEATGIEGITLTNDAYGTHVTIENATAGQIEKLDLYMSAQGLVRENGATIVDEITEIKNALSFANGLTP